MTNNTSIRVKDNGVTQTVNFNAAVTSYTITSFEGALPNHHEFTVGSFVTTVKMYVEFTDELSIDEVCEIVKGFAERVDCALYAEIDTKKLIESNSGKTQQKRYNPNSNSNNCGDFTIMLDDNPNTYVVEFTIGKPLLLPPFYPQDEDEKEYLSVFNAELRFHSVTVIDDRFREEQEQEHTVIEVNIVECINEDEGLQEPPDFC